ncbi:hypothetical protein OsI_32769 [Oryza sativa Indica Group]|uniref:Uncharacterized protein n=1 Tax=Oryza sativa subsp. indica TaxID=39946 RepID=B8BFR9_ORYSI|nr:hypothetical protein OsI_32769 [Oryza sativa Indica Group]
MVAAAVLSPSRRAHGRAIILSPSRHARETQHAPRPLLSWRAPGSRRSYAIPRRSCTHRCRLHRLHAIRELCAVFGGGVGALGLLGAPMPTLTPRLRLRLSAPCCYRCYRTSRPWLPQQLNRWARQGRAWRRASGLASWMLASQAAHSTAASTFQPCQCTAAGHALHAPHPRQPTPRLYAVFDVVALTVIVVGLSRRSHHPFSTYMHSSEPDFPSITSAVANSKWWCCQPSTTAAAAAEAKDGDTGPMNVHTQPST